MSNKSEKIVVESTSFVSDERISDNDLFAELGARAEALSQDPEAKAAGLSAQAEGVGDTIAALGRRVYGRIERELYALLCGTDEDDSEDREKLKASIGLGTDVVVAGIVTVLVSGLGLAPAIASVVAALLIRRVFKPGYKETCEFWGERLKLARS